MQQSLFAGQGTPTQFIRAVFEGSKSTHPLRGFRLKRDYRTNKWDADVLGSAIFSTIGARNIEAMLDIEPDYLTVDILGYLELVKLFPFLSEEIPPETNWIVAKHSKHHNWASVISYLWIRRILPTRELCAQFGVWLYEGYKELYNKE